MKKSITPLFILLSLIFLSDTVYGQGFLGKKIAVSYTYNTMLDLDGYGSNYLGREKGYSKYPATHIHNIDVDYILHRRITLGLTYYGFRTDIPFGPNEFYYELLDENGIEQYGQIYTHGLGFQAKWYGIRKGAIAPLGNYFTLGLDRFQNQIKVYDNPSLGMNTSVWAGHIELGRTSPIYKTLFFRFGLEISSLLGFGRVSNNNGLVENPYPAYLRLQSYMIFNYNFGLLYVI